MYSKAGDLYTEVEPTWKLWNLDVEARKISFYYSSVQMFWQKLKSKRKICFKEDNPGDYNVV